MEDRLNGSDANLDPIEQISTSTINMRLNDRSRTAFNDLTLNTSTGRSKELELQKLLLEERNRSEQRRQNYEALREEHVRLQKEMVRVKESQKQVLEHTKQLLENRDRQTNELKQQLNELQSSNQQLTKQLEEYSSDTVRKRMQAEVDRPLKECEAKCVRLEQALEESKVETKRVYDQNESQKVAREQQLQSQKLQFEAQLASMRLECQQLKAEIQELSSQPNASQLIKLKEEANQLRIQLLAQQQTIDEAEQQYKQLDERMDSLLQEHDRTKKRLERQANEWKESADQSNREVESVKLQLKLESKQKSAFERDIQKLADDKDRLEDAFKSERIELLQQQEKLRKEFEANRALFDKTKHTWMDELRKCKSDCDEKSAQIEKLQERLQSDESAKEREMSKLRQVERSKQMMLEKQIEQQKLQIQELDQEVRSLREQQNERQRQVEGLLSAKLEAEAECVLARARADSCALIEQELERARRNVEVSELNARTARSEQSELTIQVKQLERQVIDLRDQLTVAQKSLEQERHAYSELRTSSERMIERMRSAHDLERAALREQLQEAQEEVIGQRRQRAEWKAKAAQFSEAAARLHGKLKQLKSNERRLKNEQWKAIDCRGESAVDANAEFQNGREFIKNNSDKNKQLLHTTRDYSNEAINDQLLQAQLRSQYKEMKRKLDEMLTVGQIGVNPI